MRKGLCERVCPLLAFLIRNEIRGVVTEGSVPFLSTKLADGDKGRSRKSKEHEHHAGKPPLG